MSSFDRRTILTLLAAAPLAACDYKPVLGPRGLGDVLWQKILADAPADRLGFEFVSRFEDRLGRADGPLWALGYSIETDETGGAVTPGDVTTRYTLTGKLTWSIRRLESEQTVLEGTEEAFTAFSATGSSVSTLAARTDAENRLMTIFADKLVTRLYAESGRLLP